MNKRELRKRYPYPRLWALFSKSRIPKRSITGEASHLYRPESISFEPRGKYMAICNSGKYSISFYQARSGKFESKPCLVLSDQKLLKYVHDCEFSPCGNYLVAVGEHSQTLLMYSIRYLEEEIEAEMLWSLVGEPHKLNCPAGVAYHPSGKWIGVANRLEHGITLYKQNRMNNDFDETPFQILSQDYLLKFGLSEPHGLTFSKDGNYVVITHKKFHAPKGIDRESAISFFEWDDEKALGNSPEPLFIHRYNNPRSALHLASYHPKRDFLAVSDSRAGSDIFKIDFHNKSLTLVDSLKVFKVRGGAKGISFSNDGESLALTTSLDEVLFFDLKNLVEN